MLSEIVSKRRGSAPLLFLIFWADNEQQWQTMCLRALLKEVCKEEEVADATLNAAAIIHNTRARKCSIGSLESAC